MILKLCSYTKYPKHPWPSMREPCNASLLNSAKVSHRDLYKPIKVYCYKPLVSSIAAILSRPGILQACENWRERKIIQGLYTDVYDCMIWQDFQTSGFMVQPYSYGLILNIDWF